MRQYTDRMHTFLATADLPAGHSLDLRQEHVTTIRAIKANPMFVESAKVRAKNTLGRNPNPEEINDELLTIAAEIVDKSRGERNKFHARIASGGALDVAN